MGMIFNAMGAALGQGIATSAQLEAREAEREEERRLRAEERRDAREDSQAFRREMAASRGGSGSGSGGGAAALDFKEGGLGEEIAAAHMGMSIPEFRKFHAAQQSGDFSGYAQERELPGPTESGEPMKASDIAPGMQRYLSDKRKTLGDIAAEFGHGKDYKEVTEGRGNELRNGVSRGIVNGSISEAEGAETIAATKGDGAYGKGGVNQFTGAPDQVGKSQIAENNAQASNATASAGKTRSEMDGGGLTKQSNEKLTTIVNSMNTTIRSLNEGSRGRTAEEKAEWQRQMDDAVKLRDLAQKELRGRLEGKPAEKPTPKPAPAAGKGGDNGIVNPSDSGGMPRPKNEAERAALPKGARYIAPNGKIMIKG